eukprot:COSAG04_NODE_27133_length_286_cov_0.839572_1_plen_43_part_10
MTPRPTVGRTVRRGGGVRRVGRWGEAVCTWPPRSRTRGKGELA